MNKTARSTAFLLSLAILFMLAGCGSNTPPEATPTPAPAATDAVSEDTPSPEETADPASAETQAFARSDFPDFETTDIDGNAVDNSVFSEAKLTMVNMWATWCSPCVGELPELQRLSEDYAGQSFRIIGIIDYSCDDADVRSLMDGDGITYTMIHYADAFASLETGYVPTTYFVDGSGKIMGSANIGANDYEGWSELIDELLKDAE